MIGTILLTVAAVFAAFLAVMFIMGLLGIEVPGKNGGRHG